MSAQIEPRIFSRLWKILSEVMAAKESHQTIEKHEIGPRIGLPPIRRPDPDDDRYPIIDVTNKDYKH
jgi:hypothetical protein